MLSRNVSAAIQGAAFLILAVLAAGCSSARKSDDEVYMPRTRWYAHCEACKWCKGSYKNTQEVQGIVTEHNKKLHDWYKVAYYDQTDCSGK